jgi:hypothetical protein
MVVTTPNMHNTANKSLTEIIINSGKKLIVSTSLETFKHGLYDEASNNYKLIIIQFSDPFLCIISAC